MTENDVNAILVAFTDFKATVSTKLDSIATDNTRGENVHQDHEARLRTLEAVRWKIAGWSAAIGALGGGGIVAALSRITTGG